MLSGEVKVILAVYENKNGSQKRLLAYVQDDSGDRYVAILARVIWENWWGPIPPGLVVHHIDFNPINNAISNLSLMQRAAHTRLHRRKALKKKRRKG